MTTLLPGNIVYTGPPTSTESDAYKSLGNFILEKYKSFGNQTVLIDALTGEEYTAKYMYDSVVRMAHVLQHLGIKNGDVVGLSSENNIRFAITLFASFAVNATVAPLNVTYSEGEAHHAINLSKPKVIFASSSTVDIMAKVAKNNSFVKTVILLGSNSSDDKILNFDELMHSTKIVSKEYFDTPVANKEEDVALILCSSGTTGLPKGVQLTQYNFFSGIDSQLELTYIPKGEHTLRVLIVVPWFHSFGCIMLITASSLGIPLVYLPKFEANLFLGTIQKYRIFMSFMVPPLMVFLAKHPLVDKYDLSSLKVLLCGAAPLSTATLNQIRERIRIPIMHQAYGMSESTFGVLKQTDTACKPGSVGTLKLGIYAKVNDTETGKPLGPKQIGELCFKGGCIMKGYIGDAKATQATIKDGWLHTGDVGYFDDDFEFFIVDRIKELIKYKGYQVPPVEIEDLLLTNPKIKDAAVIGKPDEEAGELPMAFVVKQANVVLSEEDVIKFVANRVSHPKRLRGGVIFVDEIPKNPSGKILRRVLRGMLKKPLSKL